MSKTRVMDWQSIGNWKQGRVRSGAKIMIWISLLFGLAFTGISLPAVLKIPEELARDNYMILVALIFPLIGVSALVLFFYSLVAWRKFGITELVLNPVPGSIGGDFGGYVDLPIAWDKNIKVNLTLNCQQTTTTGSGKNRSTNTKVVWQREGLASLSLASKGMRCAFRFAIPDDLPESEKASSSYFHWLLQMECDLPGIDFKRNFSVPVFNYDTPQLSTLKAKYVKDSNPMEKAPEGTVSITATADGMQFYYPWHRHLRMAIMALIFGSVFATTGYFIGTTDAGLLFPVVFGGVGMLIVFFGMYTIGNTLTTTVSRDAIHVVRNVYGFRFQRKVAKDNIEQLERQIKSQMQGGTNYRVFYSIIAHCKDKRKITIADSLEGSRLTDYVEQRIKSALRLDDNKSLVDSWSS